MLAQTCKKAQYGGNEFRTAAATANSKHNDSFVRYDFREVRGKSSTIVSLVGCINRMFEQEGYPGGPRRLILECEWFEPMGSCDITSNKLVRRNADFYANHSSRFAFLDDCFQIPVALWPYDPLDKLSAGNKFKKCFDVIDRNQEELW
jgi:hypothetical protein